MFKLFLALFSLVSASSFCMQDSSARKPKKQRKIVKQTNQKKFGWRAVLFEKGPGELIMKNIEDSIVVDEDDKPIVDESIKN